MLKPVTVMSFLLEEEAVTICFSSIHNLTVAGNESAGKAWCRKKGLGDPMKITTTVQEVD